MASLIVGLVTLLQKCLCGNDGQNQPQQQQQQQQSSGQQGGYPAGQPQPQFQYVPGQGQQGQAQAYPPLQHGMSQGGGGGGAHQQGHGQGHGAWNGSNAGVHGGHQQAHGKPHKQSHPQNGHGNGHTPGAPLGEAASFYGGAAGNNAHSAAGGHPGQGHAAAPGKENRPPGGFVGSTPIGPYHGQNHDQLNASNTQYTALRTQARQAGDRAHALFAQSQAAYQAGDGARAHELSEQGKAEMRRKDELDEQAEGWIFRANNSESPAGTIDLHGLYVKEALEKTDEAIAQAQREGRDELRIIVGKGIHSQGHVAKIKPAVEDLMRKYNLSAHIDPSNTGVLIVDLNGNAGNGRTRDAGGLVDQMREGLGGKDEEGCVIM